MFIANKFNTFSHHCQYENVFDHKYSMPYDFVVSDLTENLKSEMNLRGWNPYQLEAACDKKGQKVHQPTIQRILSGKHKDPRTSTIQKLAIGLGISEAKLRGFIKNETNPIPVKNNTINGVSENKPIYSLSHPLIEETTWNTLTPKARAFIEEFLNKAKNGALTDEMIKALQNLVDILVK